MATLDEIVENSLYTEVKKLRDDISIVMDPSKDKLYLKKVLDVFSVPVFEYLQSHTDVHVPRVKIFWEEEDRLVVIEEYIQGTTLEELLESGKDFSGKPFAFDELKRILLGLCDGLIFLHSANPPIIHRDIKASNVIITDDGLVKIIDYNAAKQFTQGKKKDTVLIGTQGIAAPEQYGFAQSDERTDIYALGKLMESVFSESAGEIQIKDDQVRKIVDKATKLQPELRYKSVQEMKAAIEKLLSPSESGVAKKKKVIKGALAAALVLLLVSGIVLLMNSRGSKSGDDSGEKNTSDLGKSVVATPIDATPDDAKKDVEIRVKYIEGTNQTIPSSDEYDMLVVKIDLDNVGEYIGFEKQKDDSVLESTEGNEKPIMTNKLHDKGWIVSNKFLYEVCKERKKHPEDAKNNYIFTGDKLDGELEDYYPFGLVVNSQLDQSGTIFEDTFEFLGKGSNVWGVSYQETFVSFNEVNGYLVYLPERLLNIDDNDNYRYDEWLLSTSIIEE